MRFVVCFSPQIDVGHDPDSMRKRRRRNRRVDVDPSDGNDPDSMRKRGRWNRRVDVEPSVSQSRCWLCPALLTPRPFFLCCHNNVTFVERSFQKNGK